MEFTKLFNIEQLINILQYRKAWFIVQLMSDRSNIALAE